MKKIIILACCFLMGSALYAQSKSELKEQFDEVNAELQRLKRSDSLNNLQHQATVKLLEGQIADLSKTIETQNTALSNYASQVERLNSEITNLTQRIEKEINKNTVAAPRERIVIISNTQNNTFTVPEGKTWRIKGCCLPHTMFRYGNLHITQWNSKKILQEIGRAEYYDAIPEKTTFKIQVPTDGDEDTGFSYENGAEGYLIIQEWDNE